MSCSSCGKDVRALCRGCARISEMEADRNHLHAQLALADKLAGAASGLFTHWRHLDDGDTRVGGDDWELTRDAYTAYVTARNGGGA